MPALDLLPPPHQPAAAPPLLQVSALSVDLQTHSGLAPALRDVSFTLARGQTLGLIGESGSGKSITALALMGLLPDATRVQGSVRFDGTELTALDDAALCRIRGRRIGMVFQEPMTALNPLHRIGQQIAEPLRLHRGLSAAAAQAEALRLLDRVQMPQAAQRLAAWPHQLSGGQRQRVVIAIALACEPDLLIADEPTTALDVTTQRDVLDLIQALCRDSGMAWLLISHDLGVMADRVEHLLVMYGGSVVDSGPTHAVFSRLAHPYTRGLHGARPRLGQDHGTGKGRDASGARSRLATIAGRVPALAELPPGCAFAPRCSRVLPACSAALPAALPVGPGHAVRCLNPWP